MLVVLTTCPFARVYSRSGAPFPPEVYQERFDSLLPCLVTPNEHVRRSAAAVLDRVIAQQDILEVWHKSEVLSSFAYKENIWKLT